VAPLFLSKIVSKRGRGICPPPNLVPRGNLSPILRRLVPFCAVLHRLAPSCAGTALRRFARLAIRVLDELNLPNLLGIVVGASSGGGGTVTALMEEEQNGKEDGKEEDENDAKSSPPIVVNEPEEKKTKQASATIPPPSSSSSSYTPVDQISSPAWTTPTG
jgi:hypothetical protein